ncbi:uncharacterized protein LOC109723129 [Ananas comosus]|uniref:Uncharacterized protein LOC109723129 n=1 Tax=Ananas comosus TaxID=4615 RepID=A0A6P5GLM1_ANACO|nr:uncharacterized protein LOC109723129 [Ananas comosus]
MNKPSKLGVFGGRRSSEAEVEMKGTTTKTTKTKTKPSPRRSPLTDINGGSRPPLSGSGEAPRSGCFRFLLSNSSSSSSSSKNPIARSNRTLSTPRSAPPNPRTLPSRNPRNPPKKTTRPSGSKKPSPELSFEVGFHGDGATTPEKTKKAEAKPSLISPKSGTSATPPIQASISPEVPCASSVAPTPVCFAAGHVVAGVHDRRKCRPRGILAVGRDEPAESVELREKHFDESPLSSIPPPLAGASIHWLSSSPGDPSSSFSSFSKAHCEAEASVNWLLSPCEDGEESIHKEEELILPKCSFSAANYSADLWRFSHGGASPLQTTPSSGFGIQKTPTTDSSLSPFSMILKRASKSSMPKLPRVQQESGGYRYGPNAERSPFSGESSWTDNTCNVNSTAKQAPNFSVHEVDAISEVLKSISLSSKRMDSDEASLLALSVHSFQFGPQETPFESIDLSCFRKPFCDNSISGRKVRSATRISWREGLVSRIFEMGELDCCQWLSDDEDEFDHERISLSKDGGNREAACGFGSVEFTCSGSGHKEGAEIISSGPISCSDSISTEGAELISSDDSNWTLFYKNNLFAIGICEQEGNGIFRFAFSW